MVQHDESQHEKQDPKGEDAGQEHGSNSEQATGQFLLKLASNCDVATKDFLL
jgi:hypothetical protein